jgi:hypothetical protein
MTKLDVAEWSSHANIKVAAIFAQQIDREREAVPMTIKHFPQLSAIFYQRCVERIGIIF